MCARTILTLVVATIGSLCATLSADTIGYWRFEGADDATGFLLDSSGNGHTLSRSLAPGVSQVALPATGAGVSFPNPVLQTGAANGSAGIFTTTNGFLSAACDASFLVDSFTVEAFISPTTLSGNNILVGQFKNTSPAVRWFLGPTASQLRFGLFPPTGSVQTLNTSMNNWEPVGGGDEVLAELLLGKDFYVAAALTPATGGVNTGQVTFYMQNLTDGGPLLTQTITHSVSSLRTDTPPLAIGAISNDTTATNQFDGLIDEVRFSSGVLSLDQLLIVPEPGSWLLLAVGGLVLVVSRRLQRSGRKPRGLFEQ